MLGSAQNLAVAVATSAGAQLGRTDQSAVADLRSGTRGTRPSRVHIWYWHGHRILGKTEMALQHRANKTRSRPVLYVPAARVDTVKNGMFCRLPRHVNQICEKVPAADLFGSKMAFKKPVKALVCDM